MTRAHGRQSVSVVITTFNHAQFLDEAIASVLAQTVPTNEIIVIDDGSTDDTREVCSRYPAARYVWQPNSGLSAARNTGIRESKSKYIAFLDADDFLVPDTIQHGLDCFDVNGDCGFVFGGHRGVTSARACLWKRLPDGRDDGYVRLLRGNYIAMHATVLYRKDVLEAVGGFDTALPACEDYEIYLRIARIYPIASHPNLVADYRQHETNMSRDPKLMLLTSLSVLRAQRSYVAQDQDMRRAQKQGIRFWQGYYGTEWMKQTIATFLIPGRRRQALQDFGSCVRNAPCAVPLLARDALRGVVRSAEATLPYHLRRTLRKLLRAPPPRLPVGSIRFGDLRRLDPIDPTFGYSRGLPIDRHYIEAFLDRWANDIHGRVLEIGDSSYTARFGGDRVTQSDVLHVRADHPSATFTGDLSTAHHIPSDIFDCIILTQTLHLIYDFKAALRTLHRIIKPGGVLLITVPGISQIDPGEWGRTWYWAFTSASIEKLLNEQFGTSVNVEAHGNILASVAFLHGISSRELQREELQHQDRSYQVLVAARAVKESS